MEDKVEYSAEADMTFSIPSNILPTPFEWVFIPKGNAIVNYLAPDEEPAKTVWVDDFYISKYTITNAQYRIYVEETGNIPERSSFWGRPDFNQPLQPVFDLRWQEAMLYCMWLSDKLGYEVTLPSYSQWNRAARGDSNDLYPWRNEWDDTKCNCEHPRGQTMPVNHYESGQSRFGVFNMAGNVFEWCLTNSNTGLDTVDFPTVKRI